MNQPVQKRPGLVYFKKLFDKNSPSEYKLQLPYERKKDDNFLEILFYDHILHINVVNCDEKECRNFLDRACLRLLAKLSALGYHSQLGYRTKVISFQDDKDLIACFTELQLRSVVQNEYMVELPNEVLGFYADQNCTGKTKEDDQQTNAVGDKENVDKVELCSKDWVDRCEEIVLVSDSGKEQTQREHFLQRRKLATSICLRFSVKQDFDDLMSTENNAGSQATTFVLKVEDKVCEQVSTMAMLTLQNPNLETFDLDFSAKDGVIAKSRFVTKLLTEYLKQNRSATSKPLGMNLTASDTSEIDIYTGHPLFHLTLSEEYLDIFSEKKLTNLSISLCDHQQDFDLLQKALAAMSKSLYIRTFSLYIQRILDRERLLQVNQFFDGLIKIVPTLINPVYLSITSRYGNRHERRIERLYEAMEMLANKNLQIIDAFIGVVIFQKSRRSPVRILCMDILRKLREMLR